MKLTRRLLCLLLALAMVMTLTPAVAYAEEVTEEAETDRIEATVPEKETDDVIPETGPVTVEIPFQVNPLYEGMITAADLDIPELPEKDPDQIQPNAITYQTIANAGKELRKQLKNRTETFTIYVKSENSNAQAVSDELLDIAFEHTGVATEGDYIAWQFGGYGGQGYRSWNSTTQMYEFTLEFVAAYYTTADQEQEMNTAVTNLINTLGIRYKSHYDKIYAVYDWLCQNVTYDYENLEDSTYLLKYTAYAALIDRTAVCQGYAVLFYRLMLELGVDARVIVGDGGGPHAWNIVELNNLYYNLDSTWDAGQSEYIWFLNNTWDFVGHEREMDYDTIAFHNEYPMAADSYEPGKTATKDPYIFAGYCGTADNDYANAEWWLGRDGSLTIKGTGNTYNFNTSDQQPYYKYWESEITKVVVEAGITSLGEYSFYDFSGLKELVLPSTLKTIGNHAFQKCDKLEKVTCTSGLETIGEYAFGYCEALKTVSLPATVKTIGKNAFESCTSLASITLPTSLETIGDQAFYACTGLKSITIPGTAALGGRVFSYCSALETVTITDGMIEVPAYLFSQCGKLRTVKLPNSVKTIGAGAFEGCFALTQITLPANLETIGGYAFAYCGLTSVKIPETVTRIVESAFSGNSSLKTANLPKGLTVIEDYIFANCPLTSITIPNGVTEIGENAFCGAEITSLVIPEGVTRIERGAFGGCTKLTKLTLPSTLEYFNGFARCNSLTSIVLPEGVTEIGSCALQENEGLVSITIPDTVTKIGDMSFNGCTSLKSIELPEGLTKIPRHTFSSCTSLQTVYIPESVTVFGDEAFRYCSSLTELPLPEGVTRVGSYCFAGCSSLTEVTLPASVTYVDMDVFSDCVNLEKATVAMLGEHMFENCPKLHTVELLDTVTYLGGYAFRYCTSLTELEIPAKVTEIRDRSFEGCTGITALTIPASVEKIGYAPFEGCFNLKEITFVGNAPSFIWSSFMDVTATVYYPENNTTWTAAVRQNYDGNITWVPYTFECTDHSYEAVITEPTCSQQGYTTYTCTICGDSYVDNYTDPVDHSYEDGHCKWCGKAESYVKWSTISTSLGGNIAMNFYVELSENLVSDPNAYIQFSFAGRAVKFPLSQGKPSQKNGVTVYQFSCPITSKNMTDEITAQIFNASGAVGASKSMSVDTYCNWVIANFKDEKTVNLMKAMLNYGASAQKLFKYRTDDLANASLADADKVFGAVDASAYKHSVVGTEEGIIAKSMTLLLDSETTVRVYFELTGDKTIDQYTFTVDGVEVQPTFKDGKYYIERPNISAHRLDDMHVFTCGGITVTYGGLSYVNQVMTYYTEGTTFDMASALYAYSKAAEAYIG